MRQIIKENSWYIYFAPSHLTAGAPELGKSGFSPVINSQSGQGWDSALLGHAAWGGGLALALFILASHPQPDPSGHTERAACSPRDGC